MTRTTRQNRFYFSVIADVHKKAVAKHLSVTNSEFLRIGLKELDENYPKEDGKPISSAMLTTKEMVDHVEFIRQFMLAHDITITWDDLEWERIKLQARR